jgi:hypothetical protein
MDIEFTAVVNKVQTLTDGGIRVTLDLPENAIMQMAQLAECKGWGAALNVVCTPEEKERSAEENERTTDKSRKIHI